MVRHGGRIWEAARDMGADARSILDFSANMNPYGPPDSVKRALTRAIDEIQHYPDPDSYDLTTEICRLHDIGRASLVLTNGASEAIQLLPAALGFCAGVVCSPSFREYDRALDAWGLAYEFYPHSYVDLPSRFFSAAMGAAARVLPGGALYLCNPNNPTGELLSREEVVSVWAMVRSKGGTLVVDESFVDFTGIPESQTSVIDLAADGSNLCVIRSLTKFFSLPGVRLGYCVMAPLLAERLRRLLPEWNINRFAQVAGVAALLDDIYRQQTIALIINAREQFISWLNLPGLISPTRSQANFVLLRIDAELWDAPLLCQSLKAKGVLLRDCTDFPGLGSSYSRAAVRTPEQNARFVQWVLEIITGK